MPTLSELKKIVDVKYISRDFDTLVTVLKNHLKYQFPNSYKDFSDTSSGMAFLELVAYVGDILNFYIDKQFNELFLNTAQERKNLVSLAKNLGYQLRGKSAASTKLTTSVNYPTIGSDTANVEFVIYRGSQVITADGVKFEITEDVNFSSTSNRSTSVNGTTTIVSISGVIATNGELRSISTDLQDPIPFFRLTLPDADVLEITSVTSSDLNTWYQVDYLAQENQYYGVQNNYSTSSTIPYILTLRKVPRRFIVEKDENNLTSLIFGSGAITTTDDDYIPNPSDFILPYTVRGVQDGFVIPDIDPENFLNTGTLGSTPSHTTLTVKYRIGGGLVSNVQSNSLQYFSNLQTKFITNTSASSVQRNQTLGSLTVTNNNPAAGGKDGETNEEIRYFAAKSYAAQNRVVTIQDYIVRAMTMPSQFGTPFRVQARRDANTDFGVQIIVLGRNSDGTLAKTVDQLKINLGNYLSKFKPISDSLNITDGNIINITVSFAIIVNTTYNRDFVLGNCLIALKDYFKIDNWQMGEPIVISDITRFLMNIQGVDSVSNIGINNIYGTVNDNVYSDRTFNIAGHLRNNVITIEQDSIFEIRYPEINIEGGLLS